MPRFLCRICRYTMPMTARVANVLTVYLHCMQGVPGALYRVECTVFVREPGANDERPDVRMCGRTTMAYVAIDAAG
jgi:hypothetical protein